MALPAQVARRGKDRWELVALYFLVDFEQEEVKGEFVSAYKLEKSGPREVNLRKGDRLRVVDILRPDNGKETLVASEDADEMLTVTRPSELHVGTQEATAGKYLVGFLVTDLAGHTMAQYREVDVQ